MKPKWIPIALALILAPALAFSSAIQGDADGNGRLDTNKGGSNQDTSAWTGFLRVNSGVWTTSTSSYTSPDIIFPEDYGTQGDGNDSDIVRMAIDVARSVGGGDIYLSCGKDWKFNAYFRNISGVTMRGCQRAYTTGAGTAPTGGHPWKAADPTLPIITIGDSQNSTRKTRGITLRNFWMDGLADDAAGGIWLQEGSDILIDNFDISGMGQYGIKVGDANSTNVFDSDQITVSNFMIFQGKQTGTTLNAGVHLIYNYGVNYIGLIHFISGQIWYPGSTSSTYDDRSLVTAIYSRGVGAYLTNIYVGTHDTLGIWAECAKGFTCTYNQGNPKFYCNGFYLESNGMNDCDPLGLSSENATCCYTSIYNGVNGQGPVAWLRGMMELSGKYKTVTGSDNDAYCLGYIQGVDYLHYLYYPKIHGGMGFMGTTFIGSDSVENTSSYVWPERRIEPDDSDWSLKFVNEHTGGGFKFETGAGGYTKVENFHADNTQALFGYDNGPSINVTVGTDQYGIRAIAANSYTEDSVPIYAKTTGDQQAGIFESEYGGGVQAVAFRAGYGVDGVTDNGTAIRGRTGIALGASYEGTKAGGTALMGEAFGDTATLLGGWTTSNSRGAIHIWLDAMHHSDNSTILPMTVFKRYLNTNEPTWLPANGIGFEHQSIIHNSARDQETIAAKHKIYLKDVTSTSEDGVQEFWNISSGVLTKSLTLDGAAATFSGLATFGTPSSSPSVVPSGTAVMVNVSADTYGLRVIAENSDTENSVPIYAATQGDQPAGQFVSYHGSALQGGAGTDGAGVTGDTDTGYGVFARNGLLQSGGYSGTGTGTVFRGEASGSDAYFLTGWTQSNSKGAIHVWVSPLLRSDNSTIIPMTVFKRYVNTEESWVGADGIGFEHRSIIHNQAKENEFVAARHKIYLNSVTTDHEYTTQEFVNNHDGTEYTALKMVGMNTSVPDGTFEARIPLSIDTDNQTTIASTVLSHVYINNMGTTTAKNYVVQGAATGRTLCFKQYPGNSGVITIHVPATHYVEVPATHAFGSVGKGIKSSGAAGESVCILGVDATHWLTWNPTGTWPTES